MVQNNKKVKKMKSNKDYYDKLTRKRYNHDYYMEHRRLKGRKTPRQLAEEIKEANKKQFIDNAIKEQPKDDYKMAHRPTKTGITADNIINQEVESPMPRDAYEHPEYYSLIGEQYTKETMDEDE